MAQILKLPDVSGITAIVIMSCKSRSRIPTTANSERHCVTPKT